jgi:predicted ribosomally synthesized peptide with SipW-like signal peptide
MAAVAVVLAMVGAGVYASWSEGATASQNLEVGTFGMKIVAATEGAVIAPDGKSVTYAVPEIRDSAAATAPFTFTVQSFGEIPIRVDANETTSPAAPFYGLPVVPDGDTVLHLDEQVVFTAGIGWPELGMADLATSTFVTYTISGSEGDPRGTAITPTAVQKSCNANNGGISIPNAAGVQYLIAGTPVSAGFNQRDVGTYQVTAEALPGFDSVLLDYPAGGWSVQVVQDPSCVDFTLTATSVYSGGPTPAGYPAPPPAPVVDNVAHTITLTVPVLGANSPTWNCSGFCGAAPNVPITRYDVAPAALGDNNLANGEVSILASADVSPSLVGQESKFHLAYQSTVVYNPVGDIRGGGNPPAPPTLLPVTGFDLRGPTSHWDDVTGGHYIVMPAQVLETGVTVFWSGVTGTGEVTITLSFSATA